MLLRSMICVAFAEHDIFRLREILRNLRLALYYSIIKTRSVFLNAALNAAYHVCEGKHIIRAADIMFLHRKNISFIFLLFFAPRSGVLNIVKLFYLSFCLVKNIDRVNFSTF